MIRRHVALANEFAHWIRDEEGFELLAPVSLALVCFRYRPKGMDANSEEVNALNKRLLQKVNGSGEVYLTHTVLRGRYTIRMCVGQLYTERKHVERAWELLKASANRIG